MQLFLASQLETCSWHLVGREARDTAKHPAMHRTAPQPRTIVPVSEESGVQDGECFRNVFFFFFFFFFVFCPFRDAPEAYGGFKAMGLIGAVATGLRQSHSNARSEPRLQPSPRLTAVLDPEPAEQGQGSNLQPHGS